MGGSPVLFVGAFPPRRCDAASFLSKLVTAFDRRYETHSDVVAAGDAGNVHYLYPRRVVARLRRSVREDYRAIACFCAVHPSAVLNVHYGPEHFGGRAGVYVLDLLKSARKPVILTVHALPVEACPAIDAVMREICATDRVVVFSREIAETATARYGVDPKRLRVLGAPKSKRDWRRVATAYGTLIFELLDCYAGTQDRRSADC
jgi:hypothetical protein